MVGGWLVGWLFHNWLPGACLVGEWVVVSWWLVVYWYLIVLLVKLVYTRAND